MKPSNTAASIRVLSPGKGGDVTQSNDATAVGIAKNDNETKQSIDQSQPGGYGSDYTQIAGQKADNKQKADADATAVQIKPSNTAASIRVLSPGHDGDVTQSNSTTAIAAALNDNETKQSIDQTQGSSAPTKAAPEKDGYKMAAPEKDGYKDGKDAGRATRRSPARRPTTTRRPTLTRRRCRSSRATRRFDPGRLEQGEAATSRSRTTRPQSGSRRTTTRRSSSSTRPRARPRR